MKVKFTNKKLWMNFIKIVSVFGTILSFLLTVVDFKQISKVIISLCSLLILIIVFIVIWIRANKKNSQNLTINGTEIKIKYGDIFIQDGIKVIAFNEYFDSQVDDKIISKTSLNGVYINQYTSGHEEIINAMSCCERLEENVVESDVRRKYGGYTTKYQIGTICPNNDYFLLALTHFDESNKAYLSIEDYISGLMHMWNELDAYYAGRSVSIPLLGGGITRFNDCRISEQELLKYMIFTFKASQVKFNNVVLNIVLDERIRDKINLYDIRED